MATYPFRNTFAGLLLGTVGITCFADTISAPLTDQKDPATMTSEQPRLLVIAHRGASGYRPEHTLEAYRLAIQMGADFIEPDLVPTKDGILIVRHENELSTTTNVASHPEFASRKTTKSIDGVTSSGWFSEDFTLAEIKTLRARERIPQVRPLNTKYDDQYEIPTFVEVLQLVKQLSTKQHPIGIYPETKHPTYFAKEGKYLNNELIKQSMGEKLIQALVAENFTDPKRIYIQSFELENLIELKNKLMPSAGVELPLIQLYGDLTDASIQPASNFSRPYDIIYNAKHKADLKSIYGDLNTLVNGGIQESTGYGDLISSDIFIYMKKTYASGIAPWKNSILPRRAMQVPADTRNDAITRLNTQFTGAVHPMLSLSLDAGLIVHPYTLRAEQSFLARQPNGIDQTVVGEALQLYSLGVHGVFIDQPDLGVKAKKIFLDANRFEKQDQN